MKKEVSEFKKQAMLAALSECIAQSFRVSADSARAHDPTRGLPYNIESIGVILDRAALWASWAAEKAEQYL